MQITQQLFSEFLRYYKNKSASERTIENRRNGFKQFWERLKEEKRLPEVNTEDITLHIIEKFKEHLR